ncbi:MAG: hypothetical protein F4008_07285 [Gammaproteobacteria bacterium]|nr:hypothetical protein [Gammaproteobacteria bacterium]MYL13543.1 hypothetical protein [Gammaproteobacteria bacterium]
MESAVTNSFTPAEDHTATVFDNPNEIFRGLLRAVNSENQNFVARVADINGNDMTAVWSLLFLTGDGGKERYIRDLNFWQNYQGPEPVSSTFGGGTKQDQIERVTREWNEEVQSIKEQYPSYSGNEPFLNAFVQEIYRQCGTDIQSADSEESGGFFRRIFN